MTTEEKHCPVCGRINLTSDEVCGFCKPQAPSPPPSPKASQLTFWQTVVVLLLGCAVILAAIFFQMPPGENRTEVMKVACGVCLGVMIYRFLILAVALQFILPCHGEDLPLVETYAKRLVSAIKTKDEKVILAEIYPGTFTGIPPEQVAFIKKHWLMQFIKDADRLTEPMWIRVTRVERNHQPLAGWHWAIQPEYQIEIQPYKEANGGQETTGFQLVEDAVFKDGKFYIVRPIPPDKDLAAAMKKETQPNTGGNAH